MTELPQQHESAARRIGEAIRARREALDLPKATAAERAGVSRRTWTELEAGARPQPTRPVLDRIDAVLRQPVGTLYAMTGAASRAEVETLRREAVELLERLTAAGLRAVIDTASAQRDAELRDEVEQLRAAHERLSAEYERLAAAVAKPGGRPNDIDDRSGSRRAATTRPRRRSSAATSSRRSAS